MEDQFSPADAKNIYVIRRRLAELKPFEDGMYVLLVGRFMVKITTVPINEHQRSPILSCDTVDVYLYETIRGMETYIRLAQDERFKDYQPIIYETIQGINFSTGKDMPIPHLCELIQYLYRLSNLTAFW